MSELDPNTLDIASIFVGQEVPHNDIPVILNAGVAYAYATKKAEIELATARKQDTEALEKELEALEEKAKEHTYIFRLVYVPKHVRETILNSVLEKFPLERDMLGRLSSNLEADDMLTNKNWAAHIQLITGPSGAELVPTEADISILRKNAPDTSQEAVRAGIENLYGGVSAGLDSLATAHDFLSQP